MIRFTNISKRMMQCSLMLMLFLAQSVAASAETKLYMEEFSIAKGETKEVALLLDNDKAATVMQAKIVLPYGLDYVEGSVAKTSRVKGRGAEVQASEETGSLVIVETDGTIEPGEGAVITFLVERTAGLDGDHEINIEEIVVSDENAEQLNTMEEQDVKVSFVGLRDCTFAAPEAIDVTVGQEYQVDVTLTNRGVTNLSAFQGQLVLPEGLEIVPGEEGKFIYSDRIPGKSEFKFKEFDGYTQFVLSSSGNYLITEEEGVIFSFKVKATEALAENTEIKLTDLRVAATTGQSVKSPDVTISVTNASVADKAAFEAYQEEKAAEVVAMAVEGDSEASQKLIADAKAAIEAMEFDYAQTLDEQQAAIDEIVSTVAADLEAQREADAFKAYQEEKAAEVAAMALEGDSEASQKLIADAKAEIEAMEFDSEMSLDEQKAAIDGIVSTVTADLEAQRKADATIVGDVNHDGEVNVGDLVSVSNFMAGEADDNITLEDADVNKDGEVNVGDMVVISNIMSGNE